MMDKILRIGIISDERKRDTWVRRRLCRGLHDFMPCFSPGSTAQGSKDVIWKLRHKSSIQMEALHGD